MMKKVLIIGYPFPLRQGGSPRLLGLAKYLPDFGWQPIILTAPLDEKPGEQFRIIETSYGDALGFWKRLFRFSPDEDIRKQAEKRLGLIAKRSLMNPILTSVGAIVNYPDSERGWKPFAISEGGKLLEEESIDVLISSSSPVTSHIIARELKDRYKIPWLADFRDLWSQNHNYSYGPLRKRLDRRLELKTLLAADALVTVSPPWADKLSTLHKGKTTYTITNGFEPETVNIPAANLTDKFTITYTGTIYTGKQDTTKLFVALRGLISGEIVNPDEIEVRFYGSELGWLDKEIERYGLSGTVKQYGMIPQHDAIKRQRESQLLLLLDWDDPQEKGVYPGKIFEYFGAQRPILATGGVTGNVVDTLLDKTKAGRHALTVEDIKAELTAFYQEYKRTGKIAYSGLKTEINQYTHREMARKFSEVLNQMAPK